MRRREAIRNVVVFSLGTSFLYSCTDPFTAIRELQLMNLSFSDTDLNVLDKLSKVILPIQQIPELATHTALPFILKQVNDLQPEKERQLFQRGYELFPSYFEAKTGMKFKEADDTTIQEFLSILNKLEIDRQDSNSPSSEIYTLYQNIKNENLLYLRTSEYFQRENRFYEMAPGRFDGNLPISELKVMIE